MCKGEVGGKLAGKVTHVGRALHLDLTQGPDIPSAVSGLKDIILLPSEVAQVSARCPEKIRDDGLSRITAIAQLVMGPSCCCLFLGWLVCMHFVSAAQEFAVSSPEELIQAIDTFGNSGQVRNPPCRPTPNC